MQRGGKRGGGGGGACAWGPARWCNRAASGSAAARQRAPLPTTVGGSAAVEFGGWQIFKDGRRSSTELPEKTKNAARLGAGHPGAPALPPF